MKSVFFAKGGGKIGLFTCFLTDSAGIFVVNGLNRGGCFWGLACNFVLLTMGDFMMGIDEGDGDGF